MRPLGNCESALSIHYFTFHHTYSMGTAAGAVNWWDTGAYLLSTRLARVLVAIARIFQLGASLKVLKNELIRPATHDGRSSWPC